MFENLCSIELWGDNDKAWNGPESVFVQTKNEIECTFRLGNFFSFFYTKCGIDYLIAYKMSLFNTK